MENVYTINYKFLEITNEQTETNIKQILLKNLSLEFIPEKDWYKIDNFKKKENFYIGYVNPEDFSYEKSENILNLDDLIKNLNLSTDSNYQNINKILDKDIYIGKINNDINKLLDLDKLNLYTLPLNNSSKSGKRMIFSSIILSDIITNLISKVDITEIKNNFNSINQIFKFNSFSSTDKNIEKYYNIPFIDSSNNLYSKYTILIYLTGGKNNNDGILKIDDYVINEMEENTFIIFNQKYNYIENPFLQNNKIVIRSELLYKLKNTEFQELVSSYFNNSSYFISNEYTNNNDSNKYSRNLIDHTINLKKQIIKLKSKIIYLIKKYSDVIFITNGYNYWFSARIDLHQVTGIILIDYFNSKELSVSETKIESNIWFCNEEINDLTINNFLNIEQRKIILEYNKNNKNISITKKINENELNNKMKDIIKYKTIIFDSLENSYCEIKNKQSYLLEYFKSTYEQCVDALEKETKNATVLIFEKKIKINTNMITIKDNEIILSNRKQKIINTEYSKGYNTSDMYKYIGTNKKIIDGFQLPNIKYSKNEKTWKLSIDMFDNEYIYRTKHMYDEPYINWDNFHNFVCKTEEKCNNYENYEYFKEENKLYDNKNNIITKKIELNKEEILKEYFTNKINCLNNDVLLMLIKKMEIMIDNEILTLNFDNIFELDRIIIKCNDLTRINLIFKTNNKKKIESIQDDYSDDNEEINVELYNNKDNKIINPKIEELYDIYLKNKINNIEYEIFKKFICSIFDNNVHVDKILCYKFLF
jgi:hypothetical protein